MINWPEMLHHAEDWAAGFWAGAKAKARIGERQRALGKCGRLSRPEPEIVRPVSQVKTVCDRLG